MDDRRRYAVSFDGVAREYARERPSYPDALVDAACAGLAAGDRVLEIGCGTGKLTAALLARGLAVHAIDPAPNMVALAREHAPGAEFEVARFEDAVLGAYAAVFSASAFHWLDPRRSWRKAAAALKPGGPLALLQYISVREEATAAGEEMLTAALHEIAPEIAAEFSAPRALDELRRGVDERRENVSEAWSYLGHYPLAVPEAAALFGDVRFVAVPVARRRTASELNALLRTTSVHARLGPERSAALEAANRRIVDSLGGTLRSTELFVLLTAKANG